MPYSIDYAPNVRSYMRNLISLSRQGRIKLFVNLDVDLRQNGDALRENLALCVAKESPNFVCDVILRDPDGDKELHYFQFIVNDEGAAYGVLRVVYAEEVM